MLKTVSSITNAIGALNYKGTWNASTNSPALASGVGTKGDYYVVSVAGATNLDGETLWGVGDWAVFNGATWQRLEGGSTINATTVTANSYNKMAITAPATASTLTVADGKTLTANDNVTLGTGGLVLGNSGGLTAVASKVITVNKSLTLDGTDATTMTFPTTSATIARTDAAQTFTGTQTFGEAILGTNAAKVFNSGGVSIGNTTDPGATNLSVTGRINGANRYAQALSLAGGGGAVTISITAFTYGHAFISLGGVIAAIGGVSGLYLANYSNAITTIDAALNIAVTCSDATGSVTVTNNNATAFDGTIIIEARG